MQVEFLTLLIGSGKKMNVVVFTTPLKKYQKSDQIRSNGRTLGDVAELDRINCQLKLIIQWKTN